MPYKSKRRPSVSRRLKLITLVCAVLVTGLVLGAGFMMQQERLARNAAEAASFTPAPLGTPAGSGEPAAPDILQVTRPAEGPLNVVFAGDSLTYGLYASEEAKGYRPQVVAALEESGPVEATRGGQTGNTVQAVSDSITFPADTNLVVLAVGTNDVFKTEKPEYAAAYEGLVAKVQESAPDAALMCLGTWSNVDGARNYDPAIRNACVEAGGQFVPLSDIFENPDMHGPAGVESFGGLSDEFHPNDAGYAAIAEAVLANLEVQ